MIRITAPNGALRFRYDPYSLELLPSDTVYDLGARVAFNCNKLARAAESACGGGSHLGGSRRASCTSAPFRDAVAQQAPSSSSSSVADNTNIVPSTPLSRRRNSPPSGLSPLELPSASASSIAEGAASVAAIVRAPSKKPEIHFAVVAFKFHSAMFVAPFKVAPGDKVVCEADGRSEAHGVVSSVTTQLPPTRINYKLVRHMRARDNAAVQQCVLADVATLPAARRCLAERGIDAELADCEWQMDRTCLTVLVCFGPQCCTLDNGDVAPEWISAVSRALVERFVCRVHVIPQHRGGDDGVSLSVAGSMRETASSRSSFLSISQRSANSPMPDLATSDIDSPTAAGLIARI